ncbi:MAG: damage-inducible protein DinB [Spirochaetae bacterium HGW-Spirochaetae-7]|nr:MAG: damage-inducible protein DinB [Spirochaetae bacterium HGW-Spirochaetae-7]
MKETMLMFARYSRRADASVLSLLGGLSNEAREENRKSYYGSLSGLAVHLLEGMTYFHGLFRASLGDRPEKLAFLEPGRKVSIPKPPLSVSQWAQVSTDFAVVDGATVAFVESLAEKDFSIPIKLDWYGGKPGAVPLHIMLDHLLVHGIHHRGQISQILDELGVEHDFSGLELELLPL